MGLAKKFRLHLKKDFEKVMNKGLYFRSNDFSIKILKTNLNHNRFSIIINKKFTNLAVDRNTLKRRIREILRKYIKVMIKSYDIIIFPKATALNLPFKDLEKKIILIFKKARLL